MLKMLLYKLKRPYHFVKTGLLNGLPAQLKYGFPSKRLHITTITGSDGKTTSSNLLYHVLKTAGLKVGLISTIAAYVGEQEIDTGFHVTSPQPADLQKFMADMIENGFTHLVLEVTSHGAYQYRTWGVAPNLAGVTNVTHEHLDYHLNWQEYLKAKALILAKAPSVVLNEDDSSYLKLKKLLGFDKTILPYSLEEKIPLKVRRSIKAAFPEKYNQSNALLVYKLAKQLEVSDADFMAAMKSFPGVPGRMEFIPNKKRMEIVVDFAHTPNGLESALSALRKRLDTQNRQKGKRGKLIAVGGSAGLRDYAKRPKMGEIAARIADLAVFTAEDPRTESVWSIIRQMKEQLSENHHKVLSIADRQEAITFAIQKLAKAGDIVVVFGKGPEKSMCYGKTEYPWSDKQAVLDSL